MKMGRRKPRYLSKKNHGEEKEKEADDDEDEVDNDGDVA